MSDMRRMRSEETTALKRMSSTLVMSSESRRLRILVDWNRRQGGSSLIDIDCHRGRVSRL